MQFGHPPQTLSAEEKVHAVKALRSRFLTGANMATEGLCDDDLLDYLDSSSFMRRTVVCSQLQVRGWCLLLGDAAHALNPWGGHTAAL